MKKILIIILSIMYFIAGYCQTDPNFQPAGGIVIPSFLGGDYDDVTIYTPTNVSVEAYKLKSSGYELSATTKQSILAYCLNYYNNRIEFLGDATNTYNCHGYAWHMIENEIGENENDTLCMDGNSNYWIVDYASYEEVSWQENAKVTFPNITDHSAIATDQQGTLISKWGNLPLFRHHINDCPYTPKTPLKYYWIKKPVISGLLDTMYSGDTCTFSETRFIANNILGIEYNWEILNNNLIQVGPNYSSKFTVQATSHVGKDTLCLHITTPSGQTNSDTIEINLNPPVCPDPDDFTVYVEERYGDPVQGSPDGPFEVCDNTSYWICLYPYFLYDENHINDVDFDFNFGNYDVLYQGDDYIVIHIDEIYEEGTGEIYVDTDCGYVTLKFLEFVEGCGYYLMFTPNPSTYETTVSIETTSTEKEIEPNLEWELEVYSESQLLKEKKTNLKGKSTKIQTQGWKEGTYIVRVKYKDEILQGKLIVKK